MYDFPTFVYFGIFTSLGHSRPSMFLSLCGLKWVWLVLGYFSITSSLIRINRRASDHNKITFENVSTKMHHFHRLVSQMSKWPLCKEGVQGLLILAVKIRIRTRRVLLCY